MRGPIGTSRTIRLSSELDLPSDRALALWCSAMQEWIRKANIAEYEKLLVLAIEPDRRRMLLLLLAEEKAKAPPLKLRTED